MVRRYTDLLEIWRKTRRGGQDLNEEEERVWREKIAKYYAS